MGRQGADCAGADGLSADDRGARRELRKIGLLIWGNHAVRASVGAMRKTFAQIRKDGGIHGVEGSIASVKDDEKRFVR